MKTNFDLTSSFYEFTYFFRKIMFVVLVSVASIVVAQTADERIGGFINQSRWFDLNREYQSCKDSLSPLLQDMSIALLDNYFSRPEAACASISTLIDKHRPEMGEENVLGMVVVLALNLHRSGAHQQAADLMYSLAGQLEGQQVDPATVTGFKTAGDMYKGYAALGETCQMDKLGTDIKIPFQMEVASENGNLIYVNGAINHSSERMIFDTGAGVNIMSSAIAQRCGLKMLDVFINMDGIGIQKGQLAVADSICLGGVQWRNVPFLVVDVQTGNAEADKKGAELEAVIGLPVMRQMQEVQFDFLKNELLIPHQLSHSSTGYPNMLRKDGEGLQVEAYHNDEPVYFHFDSGSTTSCFSESWFNKHKEMVEQQGQTDSLRMAGVGGVLMQRTYKLENNCFRIGVSLGCLPYINVLSGIDLHSGAVTTSGLSDKNEDGVIGADLLQQYAKVIVNFRDMFVEATSRVSH